MRAFVGTIGLVFIAIVLIGGVLTAIGATEETVTAKVTKTERVVEGAGDTVSSRYLVYTQGETFQNVDSLIYMKFNSSDLYGRIEPGRQYRFVVYGFRIPVLSAYRNIISATPMRHLPNANPDRPVPPEPGWFSPLNERRIGK